MNDVVTARTESLCPQCLRRIPALRLLRGDDLYLVKECPEHGKFETVIWRGVSGYESWFQMEKPVQTVKTLTEVNQGCPFDCGLCPQHRQSNCCALLEVTDRCNLECPLCFAGAAGNLSNDPSYEKIESWYRLLLETCGTCNIQLSGGEPTLRDDLPEIIALGRSLGFPYLQLNTNGLRLAADEDYVNKLKKAGLSSVFLQFDGTDDLIYSILRGRPLLDVKKAAINNCMRQGLGVVLVATIVPGVNDDQIGRIISFGLERLPYIRGFHFQPVSYFGRFPQFPTDRDRITLPEVMREIDQQTQGLIKKENLLPSGCHHSLCSFHGDFVLMPDGKITPLTKQREAKACCCKEGSEEAVAKARRFVSRRWRVLEEMDACCANKEPSDTPVDGLDDFLQRVNLYSFSVTGMAFQDAWSIDLERLRSCTVHVVSPDSKVIPFCAYNLTNTSGKSLYRQGKNTGGNKS